MHVFISSMHVCVCAFVYKLRHGAWGLGGYRLRPRHGAWSLGGYRLRPRHGAWGLGLRLEMQKYKMINQFKKLMVMRMFFFLMIIALVAVFFV
ncbi:unnamed protein product [Dracunculus medinensis]|uniref:Transmembrane protein n=1 Tax=Dracunculus medinensis TaxID=318479 RepID=A0A0N4U1R6_DRAME|nr:unnamed protein product [Dracunculus medinensis]